MKTISNWRTTLCPSRPYLPPEAHDHLHVEGDIDGKTKVTSRIVKAEGDLITTKSGSVYQLGAPSADWLQWLAERGKAFDSENPIKVVER